MRKLIKRSMAYIRLVRISLDINNTKTFYIIDAMFLSVGLLSVITAISVIVSIISGTFVEF